MKIFVSYTQRDGLVTKKLLLRLKSHLESTSEPFIHALEQDKLKHQQLGVVIAIIRCHLILVIDSPCICESPWVRFELALGRLLRRPMIRVPIDSLSHWQDY